MIGEPLKSPRKSQVNIKNKYEVKSCKNSNLSMCKSMDKFDPLSMFLMPPEVQAPNGRSAKSSKNNKSILNQTLNGGSAVSQMEEIDIRKSNC